MGIDPKILEKAILQKYTRTDVIYEKGWMPDTNAIYLLIDGEVEIIKKYAPLKTDKFIISPGNFFGLLEVYANVKRQTSAKALQNCTIATFSKQTFEETLGLHLNLSVIALKNLSGTLRVLNDKIKEL